MKPYISKLHGPCNLCVVATWQRHDVTGTEQDEN